MGTMIKNNRLCLCFLAMIFLGLLACARQIQPENKTIKEPPSVTKSFELDARLLSANTSFSFNLFNQFLREEPDRNIFISPSSIFMALAMTYNGAASETRQAMAKALVLEDMNLEEVNRASAALRTALEVADPKVKLAIANSIWAKEGVPFKADFLQRNKDYYKAEVRNLNFNDSRSVDIINKWVDKNTNGKIKEIIDKIDPLTIMFLINATYFKGEWSVKFDKSQTRDEDFTLLSGNKKKVPLMHQSGKYMYFRGNNFQAVSLPYGEGRTSMYIFLPDENSSLKEFYQNLKASEWEQWLSRFQNMEGDIALPRFKMEYKKVLNGALTTLGMGVAFDGGLANFENMVPIPPIAYIKEVLHKTFVEVNEEGTEAAAVTKVEIGITSVRPTPQRFNMLVERPFFFAIKDNQTGTVLFMGSIVEP